jgi:hypothetical protein
VQEVIPEFPDNSETGIMVYLSILGMLHYIMVFICGFAEWSCGLT